MILPSYCNKNLCLFLDFHLLFILYYCHSSYQL
nr:MAG TPA: hypothetical protein [Caudoviricetes sp.]